MAKERRQIGSHVDVVVVPDWLVTCDMMLFRICLS